MNRAILRSPVVLLLVVFVTVLAHPLSVSGAMEFADPTPAAELAWNRPGFAEGWELATADLDGDGREEVVYGGRGIAAYDQEDLASGAAPAPLWTVKWTPEEGNPLDAGENPWVTGLEVIDVDGRPHLLATTSETDAYLIDGQTGEKVWWNPLTGNRLGGSFGFALIDGVDGPPDLFPTGGRTAISGRTGQVLWEAPIPEDARHVASGELDGQPGLDVVVAILPPGAGTDPTTIPGALTSPTIFAVSSAGELLWEFTPVSPIRSLATADVDADGRHEVLYGTHQGTIAALGAAGTPLWVSEAGAGPIGTLVTGDVDGDGRDEVFGGTSPGVNTLAETYEVIALTPVGAMRWRYVTDLPVYTMALQPGDGDDGPTLLVGAGTRHSLAGNRGLAVALAADAVAVPEVKWVVNPHRQAMSFAALRTDTGTLTLVGAHDAVLRAVDETGGQAWDHHAGGFVYEAATGDVDGDGATEAATGDDQGQVILHDVDGRVRWSDRLDLGGNGQVSGLAMGDVDGDGIDEVVATGQRLFTDGPVGTVRLYDGDGTVRWTRSFPGGLGGVTLQDLDGDGRAEVIAGDYSDGCGIRVLEAADGTTRWVTSISGCLGVHHALADVDGDGVPEIAYAEQSLFDPPVVALLDAAGQVRWQQEVRGESSAWVVLTAGELVYGGFAPQSGGHVTSRAVDDGALVWQQALPRSPDRSGASRSGAVADDLDGDERPELVISTDYSDVRLLAGADGTERWHVPLEPHDFHATWRHQSGPVLFVPGTSSTAPLVIGAQWVIGRQRSDTVVLDIHGNHVLTVPMEGRAGAIAPATFADGAPGAVIGAGLGAYAIRAASEAPTGEQRDTTLELRVVGQGPEMALQARLTERVSPQRPIAGRTIQFYSDAVLIDTAVTDAEGIASVPIPPRDRGANRTYDAVFPGDDQYTESSDSRPGRGGGQEGTARTSK